MVSESTLKEETFAEETFGINFRELAVFWHF